MRKSLLTFSFVFFFHHLVSGQQPKLMLPIGHTYNVVTAQFSPDGKRIVTASGDNTAKIWDAVTGTLIADLRSHSEKVNSASFSPDGKKIVTASGDNIAKVWDAVTGTVLVDLIGHRGEVNSALFSPDGKTVVTSSNDSTARIWNTASGKSDAELNGHTSQVNFARFSPDGTKVLTASSDNYAKLWDVFSKKIITDFNGHEKPVNYAEFSPDGKKVITSSNDHSAKIWDIASGILIHNLAGHTKRVGFAHFSYDGKKIITCSDDQTARTWDANSGKLIADIMGHTGPVKSAHFSPDGKKILTASLDSTARIWDAYTGKLLAELKGHKDILNSAQFSPDGNRFISASRDHTAKIWELGSWNLLADLKGHTSIVWAIEFSEDGKKIITTDFTSTKYWDAATGKFLGDLKFAILSPTHFSPDKKKVVLASPDNIARVMEATSGKVITELKGHRKFVTSAQFSPDGKTIVTASGDSTAMIWDATSGKRIANLAGHKSMVLSAQFSPDGKRVVTASSDYTARIWDAGTGFLIHELVGHTNAVFNAYYSPDGNSIVTGSSDYTAKLWNANSAKVIADLKGHTHWVRTVQFSPDGKNIVTASSDNTFKRWDAVNGKLLYTFFLVDSTDYLVVNASNHYDGTKGAREWLYFTCGTEVIEIDQVKDQLWVPNLAERILKGDSINAKTLDELNICGLIPLVEGGSNDSVNYLFKITPRRGGLGETILSVNGTPTKTYNPGLLKNNSGVYELMVPKEELRPFFIPGKENVITIKSYTLDNTIPSRVVKFSETSSQLVSRTPNLFAVMVGISDYKGDDLDLKYAAKDATDISAVVAGAAKKLLNNDGKEHVFMYNLTTAKGHYQLPEKKSIKKILEDIGRKATANDILLIFFAGHGILEDQKKQFYFLTADASRSSAVGAIEDVGISTAELAEWMKPQNIKAQKRILIFDACNSGQAIRDFIKIGKEEQGYVAARSDDNGQLIKAIDKLNEKSGLFILSASSSNQRAYEMGRYSQGILTYALLKAIKQQPDILEDGKYLNVSRWFNAAEETVTDLSEETGAMQQPQIVSNTNFNIGIVDEDVISKITLSSEKPLFGSSNFLNGDENIADDNLDLSNAVNRQFGEISAGNNSQIMYFGGTNSTDAFILSGRYDVIGNNLVVKVNIKQGKEIKHRFEIKGNPDAVKLLASDITHQATVWVNRQ